jgi:capsular exopolysaccharide synthesis family protein
MSRVFEALTKAAEVKQRHSDQPFEVENDVTIEALVAAKTSILDQHVKPNGAINKTNGAIQETGESYPSNANDRKPWPERIEEWLLGWDLWRYNSYPIIALEKESPAAEQYKILREQVKQSGMASLSITSPVKRDGKTTVAVNLAAALSLDYEGRVLLIDADLRAPGVHKYFDLPQSPGLTDYLGSSSKMNLKNLVQETFLPGLRILCSGKPSHLAAELLAKERMRQIIHEAQAQFPGYCVIIDSPPILSTPDPLVIARYVDGVLLVVRAGKTPRDYLTKAIQSINSSKVMGVVLNGADLGLSSKYYYYSTNAS